MDAIGRGTEWTWHGPRTDRATLDRLPGAKWELARRGVRHGIVRRVRRAPPPDAAEARRRWAAGDAIRWPGLVRPTDAAARRAIDRTRRLFDRLAEGADLEADVWRRLAGQPAWAPAGASVDLGDEREIVKVHVDRMRDGRAVARDLWVKLSWISRDPRDPSLRLRFSFGSERADDWSRDPRRARAADDLAAAVFPECALVAGNPEIAARVRRLAGRAVRFSERIVFANAPGGGAVFHHDAETRQIGVLYGQLAGRTAWLVVPKRELAGIVAGRAAELGGAAARRLGNPARALRAMERGDDPALDRLLNADPRTTRRLVGGGALHVLEPGDALLLPSPDADAVAWHSVFALGARPSLAHSYGVFAARG